MKAIGIDLGTTSISAVVLETEKETVLEARTIDNGSFIDNGKEWERIQDPALIVKKAKAVLDELLEKYPEAASIGLTGQMHGILYLDGQGRALSPLYTWQDQRGSLPLQGGESAVSLAKKECGITAAVGYGLISHLYNSRSGLTPPQAACVCTVPDYLGMVLTGRTKPLTHVSMAASMGFFDAEQGKFCEDALRTLGVDPALLPEVTEDFAVLGSYQGRPVTVALGDNQASFLGSVGFAENTVLLNVGTGGQISVLSDSYHEIPGIEARPLAQGKYILVGASLCGGRAYAILERFFRNYVTAAGGADVPQYGVMARLAEQELPEDQMRVATTFLGTRTDPSLRGSIADLSEDNFTPAGLVQGVLTGLARELYDMFCAIQAGTGIRAEALVASGNGARKNMALQKIFEKMFGAKLRLAKYKEEAACGAAISSRIGRK